MTLCVLLGRRFHTGILIGELFELDGQLDG